MSRPEKGLHIFIVICVNLFQDGTVISKKKSVP